MERFGWGPRTRSIGDHPHDVAGSTGCQAPTTAPQASADWDLRRDSCVSLTPTELDWKVWTHPAGRRLRPLLGAPRVRGSPQIIDQLCDGLPSGPDHMEALHHIKAVPASESVGLDREPLGRMEYHR